MFKVSARLRQHITDSLLSISCHDDVSRFRLDSLVDSIWKKFLGSSRDEALKAASALERFQRTRERISIFNRVFEPCVLTDRIRDEFTLMYQSEDPLSLNYCCAYGACGPGASVGKRLRNDFLTKMFASDLTYDKDALYFHYTHVIQDRWLSGELNRANRHSTLRVEGSKITTVPKDDRKRRTICIEPSLNMYYQLGAKHYLEGLVKRHHNLDVSTQPSKNKRLARIGSKTGKFATIDLSDASDSISTSLVQAVLPPDLYETLDKIRVSRASVNGEFVDLPMFSTMGNGFTFILMTALFSCLVRSVYHDKGISPKCGVNYSVFGDDIIVLTDVYPDVIQALTYLGFIPNEDKSFSNGPFRESCGGDYYCGFDVRGVFCKGLNNEADLYSLFNRLVRWSCSSGIDLADVLVHVVKEFRGEILFVPLDEPDTAGIKLPAELAPATSPDGYKHYKCLRARGVKRRVSKLTSKYPDGCLTAVIGGYIRGGSVALRPQAVSYEVTKRYTSFWDRRVVRDKRDLIELGHDVSLSSPLECWSSSDHQGAVQLISRVLTLGALHRAELLV